MTTPGSAFSDPQEQSWIQAATKLSDEELAGRRALLAERPEGVRARVEILIALCFMARGQVDVDLLTEQLDWMLARRPESDAARVACAMLMPVQDPALRELLGAIILRAADTGASAAVLGHLSSFFTVCEPERAKDLLLRAKALDPDRTDHWDGRLRHVDSFAVSGLASRTRNAWQNRRTLGGRAADSRTLTSVDMGKLEQRLAEAPDDLGARLLLVKAHSLKSLALQSSKQESGPSLRKRLQEHVAWFIEHVPGSREAGETAMHVHRRIDGDGYDYLAQRWIRQTEAHPEDADVIGNAAKFFTHGDKRRSLSLLKRARDLEPGNPDRHKAIASLLDLERKRAGPEERLALDARIHTELECAQAADSRPGGLGLAHLAEAAFEAGDWTRASELAKQMVGSSSMLERITGTGHYRGHLLLGRLALRRSDREAAKAHLLEAPEIGDRLLFKYFGPKKELARELLEAGEREVVVAYLERCARLFEMDLSPWIEAIQRDGTTDFQDLR